MAWIESHQSLLKHKKTLRVVSILRVDQFKLIGHLHALWWWALDNIGSDGYLDDLSDFELASGAEWPGDPTEFVAALTKAGFIEEGPEGRYLHDWHDYAGTFLGKREKKKGSRTRQSDLRRAYETGIIDMVRSRDGDKCRHCGSTVDWSDRKGLGGGTYDLIDPNGGATVDNLLVSCRSCSTKALISSAESNAPSNDALETSNDGSSANLTTVPNRTAPEPTGKKTKTVIPPAADGGLTANGYPPEFEEFWLIYPRQKEKRKAFKVWQARRKGGVDPQTLVAAATNYATECQRKGTESQFIKLPATFLGPDKPFEEYIAGVPESSGARAGPLTRTDQSLENIQAELLGGGGGP